MKLVILLLVGISSFPASGAEAEPVNPDSDKFLQVIDNTAGPVQFVPLELSELKDPASNQPIDPYRPIVVISDDGAVSFKSPDSLLDKMNATERLLNSIGVSLRDQKPEIWVQGLMDPDYFLRKVRAQVEGNLAKIVENILPPKEDCPVVKLADLGGKADASVPHHLEDLVNVGGGKMLKVSELIPELNEQQQILCSMGFSLLDDQVPGSQGFLEELMTKRLNLMDQLGFTENHPFFQLTQDIGSLDVNKMMTALQDAQDLMKKPSFAKAYSMAHKYEDIIPEEYRLPEIPTIPSPTVQRRTDLKMVKKMEWKGIDEGEENTLKIYADAWFELRAGRKDEPESAPTTDHAAQGLAKAGIFVMNQELNLAGATLDSELSPKNAYAKFEYCFVGSCETKQVGATDIGVKIAEPDVYTDEHRVSYSHQFVIGVIPAFVRYGASVHTDLGYVAGLNLMMAEGKVNGRFKGTVFIDGAVGVEGFVEAGARGEMIVIDDQISAGGEALIKFASNGQPTLDFAIIADNDISAFNGVIQAFARVDLIGAPMVWLNKVLDSVKDLPGIGKLVENLDDLGVKLSDDAKKVLKKWGSELQKVGDEIEGRLKCCKVKVKSPFSGIQISGTRVEYKKDLFSWPGHESKRRIFNYKMYVGPDGQEYGGDFTDYEDEGLAELQQANLEYLEELAIVNQLEADFVSERAFTEDFITGVLGSELTAGTHETPSSIALLRSNTDDRRIQLLRQAVDAAGGNGS